MIKVNVSAEYFDAGFEINKFVDLCNKKAGSGAFSFFIGSVRSENGRLSAIDLEHYPDMAESELNRVALSAASKFTLNDVLIIHRFGRLEIGQPIVLVATASPHRKNALKACEYIIDYLKTEAPFWKREIASTGSLGEWVAGTAVKE